HSDMYKEYNNNNKNMSRLLAIFHLYDNYDYLISVSNAINAINKKHLSKFVKNKNKLIAIENSFNSAGIIEKSCQSIHNISPDTYNFIVSNKPCKVFISISRLSPEKNIHLLIDAFSRLTGKFTESVLIIVGSGREYKRLKQQVAQLELTEKVFFTKHLNNPFPVRSEEHTSELQSRFDLVCRLLLEK